MEKYYVETHAPAGYFKFIIYDENGERVRGTSELPDGLKRAVKRGSVIADLYDDNVKIGDIIVLGTRTPGAAQVAAEAFKNN